MYGTHEGAEKGWVTHHEHIEEEEAAGEEPEWPAGHPKKHSKAAEKGWERRDEEESSEGWRERRSREMYGTSEGAIKGWVTRYRHAYEAEKAGETPDFPFKHRAKHSRDAKKGWRDREAGETSSPAKFSYTVMK